MSEFIQAGSYQRIKLIRMSRTNSYSNHWWYQLVYGNLYSWRLNNSYVWLCIKKELTLFVRIHSALLLDIDCSCMNDTNGNGFMWVLSKPNELWQGGTARKILQEEKTICPDTSSHPRSTTSSHASIRTLGKVSNDAVSHWTNQWQWHRTESQQWLEIKHLAIRKTYTNWYNWNWN